MSDHDFRLEAIRGDWQGYWNEQYNTPEGSAKVSARKAYYHCVKPGELPPDWDGITIQDAQYAGITDNATIVDVGCSYPHYLQTWQLTGHKGRLIGVEPNFRQFNGLPYWKPLKAARKVIELTEAQDPTGQNDLYVPDWGQAKHVSGIELYQTDAGNLPLRDHSADAVFAMWSLYQLPPDTQQQALEHIDSKLKPEGLFAATLSGNNNKLQLVEIGNKIARLMSDMIGQEVIPPPALQSGFTAEKAAEVLPRVFKHVYQKRIKQDLVVYDTLSLMYARNAVLSLADRFVDRHNKAFPPNLVQEYIDGYFSHILWPSIENGQPFRDQADRSVFFCSQQPLDGLPIGPNEYVKL